ncbi:MAG: hypothetical protein ACFB21_13380, partial [Opitutales bacterium]
MEPYQTGSGETRWRVSGTLDEGRIRRSFKTREQAEQVYNLLVGAETNAAGIERPVMTHLDVEQVQQAERLFAFLEREHPGKDADWLIAQFQRSYSPELIEIPMADAIRQ